MGILPVGRGRDARLVNQVPRGFGPLAADLDEILTVEDLRAWLKLPSRWAVYRLVRVDGCPARRIGGRLRFHRDEVRRWFLTRGAA